MSHEPRIPITQPGFNGSCHGSGFWSLLWFFFVPLFSLILSMTSPTGWWFQIFFIFTPTWGNDPIWLYHIFQIHIFQMGWNHQPGLQSSPRNLMKDVSHLAVVSGGAYTAACYVTHLLKASDETPPQLGSQVETLALKIVGLARQPTCPHLPPQK